MTALSPSERDFFTLVQAGLWERTEPMVRDRTIAAAASPLSPAPDWDEIYRLACTQTVVGIVADGISALGVAGSLSAEQMDNFVAACGHITAKNFKINALQTKICKLLDDAGIRHYVVKGQNIASLYRNPLLRCSGDIDILLSVADLPRARQLMEPLADGEDGDYNYAAHKGYYFGKLEVELHGTLHPDLGDGIDAVIDTLQKDLFEGSVTFDTFNAYYIFLHCLQHLHFSGLGLRQIMDWAVLMSKRGNEIDFLRLQRDIEASGLGFQREVFRRFIGEYLGASTDVAWSSTVSAACQVSAGAELSTRTLSAKIAASRIKRGADCLWRSCKFFGNMGHHSDNVVTTDEFWSRKAQKLRVAIRRFSITRPISPNLARQMLKRDLLTFWGFFVKRVTGNC